MDKLRSVVRGWSSRAEALIVIIGAFGYSLFSTAFYLLGLRPRVAITEYHLRALLIYEPVVLLILGGFLHLRGWTFKRLGLSPGIRDTLIGVGLAIGAYAAYVALWILVSAVNLRPTYLNGSSSLIDGHFALTTVIAVSIVNPLFEELFVCGYLISVARENGHLAKGVNASIAIRLAYHLYQGGIGVIGVIPVGLIFALWYSKTNRPWPVVVAHAVADFAGLASFVG
jgi:uncharacterized protein